MVEVWLNTFIILFLLCGTTLLANLAEYEKRLKFVLFAAIMGFNLLLLSLTPLVAVGTLLTPNESAPTIYEPTEGEPFHASQLVEPAQTEPASLSLMNGLAGMAIAVVISGMTTAFLFAPVRQYATRFFPQPQPTEKPKRIFTASSLSQSPILQNGAIELVPIYSEAEFETAHIESQGVGFRPESMVHVWAFALVLYFMATQLMTYFLTGGLSGVAEDIQINYGVLVANFLPQLLIPLMGVGLFLRRNPRQTLERLGLRLPSFLGIGVAIITTIGLVIMVFMVSVIWVGIVGTEAFEEQTQASDALAESINTLGLAFMVAFTAGVGEELAFRGALQPIFGFWFATLTFVLSHNQYTLTPATLIILVVAMSFGLIRKYMDTTTAIMTHFLYNFTLLVLSLVMKDLMPESTWLYWLILG